MAPRQFIFFLKWAAQFHKDLQDFYRSRSREALSPEVETLLMYLARHEASLAHIIETYEDDAPQPVLEAWFKVAPDLRAVHFPEEYEFAPNATVEEVIDKALAIDESLIAIYKMLLRQAGSDHLQEILQDLLAEEQREEVRLLTSQR
jgi:dsDNA-binding SOS-regulon protein